MVNNHTLVRKSGLSQRLCSVDAPQDDGDAEPDQHADDGEEEDAAVSPEADNGTGERSGQEEGDISEGGINAQG